MPPRKRIKLSPEKAIFIFVDDILPPTAALMSSIYEEHKDEDGELFLVFPVGRMSNSIRFPVCPLCFGEHVWAGSGGGVDFRGFRQQA
jgi:hypothetical protein